MSNNIIYFQKPVQDDKSIIEQRNEIMEQHEEINPTKGMKYCDICKYWYDVLDPCSCYRVQKK